MVRTSGIREKARSNALKELARERGTKRARLEEKRVDDYHDQDDNADSESNREQPRSRNSSNSLLSILPKPKNSSAFGPTVKLDELLKLPERTNEISLAAESIENSAQSLTEDGMIEVDVSRIVSDVSSNLVKDLTVEKTRPNAAAVVPKGKEKQKNQITYLAQLSKATELEHKEQGAQSRVNKAAARSKYGW